MNLRPNSGHRRPRSSGRHPDPPPALLLLRVFDLPPAPAEHEEVLRPDTSFVCAQCDLLNCVQPLDPWPTNHDDATADSRNSHEHIELSAPFAKAMIQMTMQPLVQSPPPVPHGFIRCQIRRSNTA